MTSDMTLIKLESYTVTSQAAKQVNKCLDGRITWVNCTK